MMPFGLLRLTIVTATSVMTSLAAGTAMAQAPVQERIQKLVPELETYLQAGMATFKVPGVAVGIVHGDKLVYSNGFGLRERGRPDKVGAETIFQIGSTTKAFLATTMAQAVDAEKLAWNDRVVDLLPEFQLSDPWLTREFRMLDLPAQRSGLTPYVNDGLTVLGFDEATLIRSLRYAPVTASFRSDFSYLNIPHMVAGRILAQKEDVASWNDVVRKNLLDPLGMRATSATSEAIEKAPDHATGHRATAGDPVTVPFHAAFPYALGPAGNLNSNVPDLAQWLRLHLGRGQFGDKVIVSEKNLDVTWTPRVAISERLSYAVGWIVTATPNGRVIWHNGGTSGFGAHVGFLPDRDVGIVVLTNLENNGFPDAIAQWFYDRILGNTTVDNVALAAEALRVRREAAEQAKPKMTPAALQDVSIYAGTYTSPLLGEANVSVSDAKLLIKLESDAVLVLTPLYADVFSTRLLAEGAFVAPAALIGDESAAQMRFERNERGDVVLMRWIDPALPQVFERRP
ncbi:serine hydrolase [Microvirga sp. 2MCAF38]|uniref:serine hydrolase n=1 Tax=Microvirga sp. 2MCAF38 TaxID=3232989 RepID=UPI003F998264